MKNSKIKVLSVGVALAITLGLTSGYTQTKNNDSMNIDTLKQSTSSLKDERGIGNLPGYDTGYVSDNGIYQSKTRDVITNEYATYAIFQNLDGTLEMRSWGYNEHGLLGNGDENTTTKLGWAESAKVDLDFTGKRYKFSESLNDTVYVVLTDRETGMDEVWAWGNNDQGQLFIDDSIEYVTTPTRILEDKIEDYMTVVGVDAGVGSTVVYAQGQPGSSYKPLEYNNESLYIFGAGDTSKDQDAQTQMFSKGIKIPNVQYIDSDGSDYAYTLAYEDAGNLETDDSTIVAWGDNSNQIMGTPTNEQPSRGLAEIGFDDEYIENEANGSTAATGRSGKKVYSVAAGENNFYYAVSDDVAELDSSYPRWKNHIYATGDKSITGEGVGYYDNGANLLESYVENNSFGWINEYEPEFDFEYTYLDMSAGSDFATLQEVYLGPETENYYFSEWTARNLISGFDTNGQLGNGDTESDQFGFLKDDFVWETDSTNTVQQGTNGASKVPSLAYDYLNIDTNKHSTLSTGIKAVDLFKNGSDPYYIGDTSISENGESMTFTNEIFGSGSNSNGMFDKYAGDNLGDQQTLVKIGSDEEINLENIDVQLVEDSITGKSFEFTVDTSNDSGLINPNSYYIGLGGDAGSIEDEINTLTNFELVSFEDSVATYRVSGLEYATEYNFDLLFNDLVIEDIFTVTTKEDDSVAPTVNSLTIWQDESIGDEALQDTFNVSWDITDNNDGTHQETIIDSIKIYGDVTEIDGDVSEGKLITTIGNVNDFEGQSIGRSIFGGFVKFENIYAEIYYDDLNDPLVYESDQVYENILPMTSISNIDDFYTRETVKNSEKTATLELEGKFYKNNLPADADIEIVDFQIVDIDDRLNPDYITTTFDKELTESTNYFETSNVTVVISDFEFETTYSPTVTELTWKNNADGNEYSQQITFDEFSTSYSYGPKPVINLEVSDVSKTTASFDWTVDIDVPAEPDDYPTYITSLYLEDTLGEKVEIEFDEIAAGDSVSGTVELDNLLPETEYRYKLVAEYHDHPDYNHTESTDFIVFTTLDGLPPVAPTLSSEEIEVTSHSITNNFEIQLPSHELNPDNNETEIQSVSLYLGDETTPAVTNNSFELGIVNDDGIVSSSITLDGLEDSTEYTWHIEIVSNSDEIVVGPEHTTTTSQLEAPQEPELVSSTVEFVEGDTYNVNYSLDVDPTELGQSTGYLDSVEFVYGNEVIGSQEGLTGAEMISGTPYEGTMQVSGLPFQSEINDALFRVGYSDIYGNTFTKDINCDPFTTTDYQNGAAPEITNAELFINDGFEQVSQTTANIYFDTYIDKPELGYSVAQVTQARVVSSDGTILGTAQKGSNTIAVEGLEAGTTYSDLAVEVDYDYVRPISDPMAGEFLAEGGTVSKTVKEFTTLEEGEITLSGNIKYTGYSDGNVEGILSIIDSDNAFIPQNFKVSVMENGVRTLKEVTVTPISTKNSLEPVDYSIVIHDVQEGIEYTEWEYSINPDAELGDGTWTSFEIEDPNTGETINNFEEPESQNSKLLLILVIALILLLAIIAIAMMVMKKSKDNDDEE